MKINVTLVISTNCSACERANKILKKIQVSNPAIFFNTVDINSLQDNRIAITPALLIDNELFSYGDIDTDKLELRLN